MKALTISSCVVIWCLLLGDVISQLRFNAFNIQIFGQAKMEDPAVVQSLVEVSRVVSESSWNFSIISDIYPINVRNHHISYLIIHIYRRYPFMLRHSIIYSET